VEYGCDMIKNIESTIESFLLLNEIERSQVSELIEIINTGTENEKYIILESLGLEHCSAATNFTHNIRS